jgi:hypothetical protein
VPGAARWFPGRAKDLAIALGEEPESADLLPQWLMNLICRVEAQPFQTFFVFVMRWVGEDLDEVAVSSDTTAVLRWAGPAAILSLPRDLAPSVASLRIAATAPQVLAG